MSEIRGDLRTLAATLADWAAPADTAILYLFGSRVRGDHRPDSDVDLSIELDRPTHADILWWTAINSDDFVSIDVLLPGKLHILEEKDGHTPRIRAAPVVHRDRNVYCVFLAPKP
jgi:predicted nucleotidyltransferase